MRKYITLLLFMCMIIIPSVCNAEEDTQLNEAIAKIYAVDRDYEINKSFNSVPTRGEFVTLFSKTAVSDMLTCSQAVFEDTADDEILNNSVYTAMELGAVSRNDKFYPADEITYSQAMKMAVCALGYKKIMNFTGDNWENMYISAAASAGITDGVSGAFTRRDMYILIGNMLSADMVVSNAAVDEYSISSDKNILNTIHEIYYIDDIVNANGITSVYNSIYVNEDRMVIGAEEFDNPYKIDLLGFNVRAYYKLIDDTPTVIYAIPQKNSIASVDTITVFSEDELEGTIGDADKKYRLYKGYTVILNGKTVETRDFSEYYDTKDAKADLIDNNSDGYYDIVNITIARYTVVSNVSVAKAIIYDKNGSDSMIDMSHEDAVYSVFDMTENGTEEIELSDLLPGDMLMVYSSDDGLYFKVYRFHTSESGPLVSNDDDNGVTIGENKYKYSAYAKKYYGAVSLGNTVTAGISPNNTIVCITFTDNTRRYGWIMKAVNDEENEKIIIKLYDMDESQKTLYLAEKTKVDGRQIKYKDGLYSAVANMLSDDDCMVKYKLNEQGDIYVLDFPSAFSGNSPLVDDMDKDNNFTCYYKNVRGQYRYRCPMFAPYFAVASDGITFAIPVEVSDREDESNYYIINYTNPYDSFEHNSYYYVSGYDLDGNGRSKVSVYFTESKKSTKPESRGVVVKSGKGIDSDDIECSTAYIYSIDGTYKTYYATEDTEDVVSQLKPGDIVSFNNKGSEISRIDCNYSLEESILHGASYMDFYKGYLYSNGDGVMYMLDEAAINKASISFNDLKLFDVTQQTFIFIDAEKKSDGSIKYAIPQYKPASEAKTYLSAGTGADFIVVGTRFSENSYVFVYNFEN